MRDPKGGRPDPLTVAVASGLWPYLKSIGFLKTTSRKFARERDGIIQQVWVDAAGFGGASRTFIVLCCNFPFGSVNGYMDPHGFRICKERTWDLSTPTAAEASVLEIVTALKSSQLEAERAVRHRQDAGLARRHSWERMVLEVSDTVPALAEQ